MVFVYLKLIAISIVGMAFQLFFKSKSQQETAKGANVVYTWQYFIVNDRRAIIGTLLTLALFFLLFGDIINSVVIHSSDKLEPYLWGYLLLSHRMVANMVVMIICVTVAYMGQDVALRFLGRTSKELKAAMQYKAKGFDTQSGTTENPTPTK